MGVDVGGAVGGVKDALIFFDGSQSEDDKVMHESQSLASFPVAKNGPVVDFVLGFGEDFHCGVAPVGIGTAGVGDEGGLGLGGELGVVVEGYAVGEKVWVERDGSLGVSAVGSAEAIEKDVSKYYVIGRDDVWGF